MAACGGTSDSARVDAAISGLLQSGDPAACTRYATTRLHEELEGFRGRVAVERCRIHADDPGVAARSTTISAIAIRGDRASAHVRIRGGTLGGQVVDARLVRAGDGFKVDALAGLKLRGTLLRRFEARFARGVTESGKVTDAEARCILARIEPEVTATEVSELGPGGLPAPLAASVRRATAACVRP